MQHSVQFPTERLSLIYRAGEISLPGSRNSGCRYALDRVISVLAVPKPFDKWHALGLTLAGKGTGILCSIYAPLLGRCRKYVCGTLLPL